MRITGILITSLLIFLPLTYAEEYGGIEFPDGPTSFADEVSYYEPTSCVEPPWSNPEAALGVPDRLSHGDGNDVSIGHGGSLELRFIDNSLSTSNDSAIDLWVFEVGSIHEACAVFISVDGTNWIYTGDTTGATSGVDIDAFIGSGVEPGVLYSYVKLVDLYTAPDDNGPYCGADIDAVGAISSDIPAFTISSNLTCMPSIGTLPFATSFAVSITNLYSGQIRQMAGHIDINLGSGGSISNWRAGYVNLSATESFTTSWNQTIPNSGGLIGNNVFVLVVEDVTPLPYNQPPYPPSGDTDSSSCTVIGIAP